MTTTEIGQTRAEQAPLTPQHFHEVLLAYCGSKALMSAVEIDLFSILAGSGGMTEAELRRELSLHPRLSRHFLEVLVELDLLAKEGDRYRNSPVSELYLDRAKPTFVGGFAETTNDTFYPAWGKLTTALRTGQAQAPIPPDDSDHLFRVNVHTQADRVRRFMTAMDSHSTAMARELARLLPWDEFTSFADIGGCRGNLAAHLVLAQPHLKGVCFDRAQSEPFFDEHVAALGTVGRVTFQAGDFFADDLPKVDVLVFGHVLHDWSPENRLILMERAHRALNPGGMVVVYDRMIDGSPLDLHRLFYSLTFMLASGGGSEYSVDQLSQWLAEAGFHSPQSYRVLDDHTVVVARR
ncbi:methyltransferase [Nocardia sp. NPDC051570]|uniref:methyltransferase n=1 Tax=Nocardia sp. NPDC051570 TaxID=3364324 RepID=UPI0037A56CFB